MATDDASAQTKIFTPPYTVLATIYDEMMSHVNYKRWAKYIFTILKREHFENGLLLDIGCGTGEFLNKMLKYKSSLDGCDSSIEMLEVAKRKLPQIGFQRSGFPDLKEIPLHKYDIIVCLFDTMNYLLNESELETSFNNVFRKLRSPGIFIFDVVTKSYCQQYFHNYVENEVIEKQIAYARKSMFDPILDMQVNNIRIYTRQGIFEEVHKQKIYDLQFIKDLILEETLFHFIEMLDDFSFQKADQHSGRVHFILKKP